MGVAHSQKGSIRPDAPFSLYRLQAGRLRSRLLFLVGGFLVGFEEGLLDVGGDEIVDVVLWLLTVMCQPGFMRQVEVRSG